MGFTTLIYKLYAWEFSTGFIGDLVISSQDGGEVTPLYGPYSYVLPQRVWLCSNFGQN